MNHPNKPILLVLAMAIFSPLAAHADIPEAARNETGRIAFPMEVGRLLDYKSLIELMAKEAKVFDLEIKIENTDSGWFEKTYSVELGGKLGQIDHFLDLFTNVNNAQVADAFKALLDRFERNVRDTLDNR